MVLLVLKWRLVVATTKYKKRAGVRLRYLTFAQMIVQLFWSGIRLPEKHAQDEQNSDNESNAPENGAADIPCLLAEQKPADQNETKETHPGYSFLRPMG